MEQICQVAKSKCGVRWWKEHFDGRYVKCSKGSGYHSRASCKLLEIDLKDRLLNPMGAGGPCNLRYGPNMSGNASIDQSVAMPLIELALDLACEVLEPGGQHLVNVSSGEGGDTCLRDRRESFFDTVLMAQAGGIASALAGSLSALQGVQGQITY